MTGLLDYFNYSQGLLSPYDEQLRQNQQAQAEFDTNINRDFTPQDYLLSSDPYTQAIKQNDLNRYQGGFPEAVQSGFNTAKNYVADAISGQNRLDYEREGLLGKQAIAELPQDEQQQAIAQNAIESGLDWTAAGMIGGPLAKNANLKMLAKAKEMKKAGANKDLIFQETFDPKIPAQSGWYLDHPDNVPRFEIDDSSMIYKPELLGEPIQSTLGKYRTGRLGDATWNETLDKNYQDLLETELVDYPWGGKGGIAGQYSRPQTDMYPEGNITLWNTPDKKSVVAHELQHAIQGSEGMSKGGNTSMFNPIESPSWTKNKNEAERYDLIRNSKQYANELSNGNKYWDDNYNKKLTDIENNDAIEYEEKSKLIDGVFSDFKKWSDKNQPTINEADSIAKKLGSRKLTPYDQYRRMGGESEARLTQDRINYSMDERLIDPFYDNYDVPFEDMILRNEGGLLSQSAVPDWQKTIAQYNQPVNKKPQESIYIPVGDRKIEVIQNPSASDISAMQKEAIKQYGRSDVGDSPLRFTEDAQGNRYVWKSSEAVHQHIEPKLGEKVGVSLNQNAGQKSPHRNIVRRALYEGEPVPQNVLDEYPDLLDEILGMSGSHVNAGLLK